MDGNPVRLRWYGWLAVLIVLGGLLSAGAHLRDVHSRYGVWAWSPGRATPQVVFRGRDYLRGNTVPSLIAGFVPSGAAPGGGEFFAPVGHGLATTVLQIRYPDGTVVGYALSGGP